MGNQVKVHQNQQWSDAGELGIGYDRIKTKYNDLIKTRDHKKDLAIKMSSFLTSLTGSKDELDYLDESV